MIGLLTALLLAGSPQESLDAADRACLARLSLGDISAARQRCAALEPPDHPIAAYWGALLEPDSAKLRARMDPQTLFRLDPPGKRILLLAARYHHLAGNSWSLGRISKEIDARYPNAPERDTVAALLPKP
ncbi:MAG: hypothetical protein H6686_01540 [Fibrobacteria bacterium]|nr:hypothetical protein [Fibrobacteria bacterium]